MKALCKKQTTLQAVVYLGFTARSGVASPKIWGGENFLGGWNVWFLANSIILFRKTPLKAQNDYIFQKFGGEWPLWPPWLRLWLRVETNSV